MKNQENYFWGLIEGAPFLRDYLTEIESKIEPEGVVEELLGFYREVDVLIEEVLGEVSRHSSFVFRYSEEIKGEVNK
ncbi:MAG: hypothetical protein U9Q77_07620 [Candidatus Marinimicrobia bacterium]|nr:hypothetical protein [Candidatus Neomarinimicrobiota bacterium]